jgi:hypothetical protein
MQGHFNINIEGQSRDNVIFATGRLNLIQEVNKIIEDEKK